MEQEVTTNPQELLDEEIFRLLGLMESLDPECDGHGVLEHRLLDLYDRRLKETDIYIKEDLERLRLELERQEKEAKANLDVDRTELDEDRLAFERERLDFEKEKFEKEQERQKKNDIKDIVKIGLEAGGTIASAATFISLVRSIQQIEQTGSCTSKLWQVIFRNAGKLI